MREILSKNFTIRYLNMIDGYVKPVTQTFKEIDKNITDANYVSFSKEILDIIDTNDIEPLIYTVEMVKE